MSHPWLVIVDPQVIFADPSSEWVTPEFDAAAETVESLLPAFGDRVLVTRWLPTASRDGSWGEYFAAWPFADVPADDRLYELVPRAREWSRHPPIDRPTFGKWGPELVARVGGRTPAWSLPASPRIAACCPRRSRRPTAGRG